MSTWQRWKSDVHKQHKPFSSSPLLSFVDSSPWFLSRLKNRNWWKVLSNFSLQLWALSKLRRPSINASSSPLCVTELTKPTLMWFANTCHSCDMTPSVVIWTVPPTAPWSSRARRSRSSTRICWDNWMYKTTIKPMIVSRGIQHIHTTLNHYRS